MGGFVMGQQRGIADDESLGEWLGLARNHIATLPAKSNYLRGVRPMRQSSGVNRERKSDSDR